MNQKTLIIAFVLLFAASTILLFWQNERELNPDRSGSWWALSFVELDQPTSLAFIVENHSDTAHFDYKVLSDRQVLSEASLIVEKGKSITIVPEQQATPGTRASIIVNDGKETKEIYR